jgi:hypothetical protein
MKELRASLAALVVMAVSIACMVPAMAFDTGSHADLTVQGMQQAGFNRQAADVVQVENWLTDFYTSRPFFGSADQCELEKLHFDDVFNAGDIARYWARLTANTKAAVEDAARANDRIKFYSVLAVSLHVVQDFYTHSNWVEAHGAAGPYHTASWFDPRVLRPQTLFTGWYHNCLNIPQGNHIAHGGYYGSPPVAMNHDSYVRPNWDRAYVYAYAATYEWIQNAVVWARAANPTFPSTVMNLALSQADAAALASDRKASIYISEWVINPISLDTVNGHWQGNPSGNAAGFAAVLAAWGASHDSIFVNAFKVQKYFRLLSAGLYASAPVAQPAIITAPIAGSAFGMRTLSVYANSAITGTDSYFGELTPTNVGYGNYAYRDASQYHRPRTAVPWHALIVLPAHAGPVALHYRLWNEWSTTNNDPVPIQGGSTLLTFSCDPGTLRCAGNIAGGPWSASAPYVTRGTGTNGVEVKLYFTNTPLVP